MTLLSSIILRDTLANRPTAGTAGRLFYDTTNSILYRDNGSSWESVEGVSSGGAVATDAIWDATGDLAVGTGANTASKLVKGSDYDGLITDSSTATDLRWVPGASVLLYDYTVAGADKATIDTGTDTPNAGIAGTSAFPALRLLEVHSFLRSDEAAGPTNFSLLVNNDTSSIYDLEVMYIGNTTFGGGPITAGAFWSFLGLHGASGSASYAASTSISIPCYADTTFWKGGTVVTGIPDAAAGNVFSASYQIGYRSTSAITRLKFACVTGGAKFKVGSRVLIYAR